MTIPRSAIALLAIMTFVPTVSAATLNPACLALLTEAESAGKVGEALRARLIDVPVETAIMYAELRSGLDAVSEAAFLERLQGNEAISVKRVPDGRLAVVGPKAELLRVLSQAEVRFADSESGIALELHDAAVAPSDRQSKSTVALLMQAVGSPRDVIAKLRRFASTIALYADRREITRRETMLRELGFVEQAPSFWQRLFGGFDMLRFFIVPGAKQYYESRGISFSFHQVLRFLDDPVSVIDPIGIYSNRDTIITHIMQVVHADPIYDFQLLQLFPEGLTQFHRQLRQMVDGTHPRAKTIGAIVEDPTYHRRLLRYTEEYLANPNVPRLARDTNLELIERDPHFRVASETFTTLPGFLGYASKLPNTFVALLRRHRDLKEMPGVEK